MDLRLVSRLKLKAACEKLYDSIVNKKMYLTGGIGSTRMGEAFEEDLRLPNETAYTETCAAIGLIFFSQRMALLDPTSAKYADLIERILYNIPQCFDFNGYDAGGKDAEYEAAWFRAVKLYPEALLHEVKTGEVFELSGARIEVTRA